MLLVSAFLMTQVAMAGAALTVDWSNPSPIRTNSIISGTITESDITGNVYATVYASVIDQVYDTIHAFTSPVVTADYIYGGKTFTFGMSNFAGLTVGRSYKVALNVYAAETADAINLNVAPTQKSTDAFPLYSASTSSSGGSSGGGTSTPAATVTPTVTTSASSAITAADGGTVTAGGISVTIPAGALSGNGTVNVTPVTDLANIPAGALMFGSTVVEITVTGATLIAPVTITLNYDAVALAGVPAEQIGVYYWNESRGGWLYCGGTVNAATGQVSVSVNHFTKFAVMADKALKVPADVTGHWAFDSIKRLLGMKVVSGYPDGTYLPNNNITRAEFAKIIVDAMGYKVDAAASLAFADAADIGDWAKGYVATAVSKGLISGYSDNTFKPASQITRAEIATIVVKALGKTAEGTPTFADASSVPAWAAGYINVAAKEGILSGYTDNTIKATNNATRAEAAKMTTNMLTNLKI